MCHIIQAAYEANSGQDAEKIAWLQSEIKHMADSGALTASEQKELLGTLESTIAGIEEEISKAKAEAGAQRKVEKLGEKRATILKRKETIAKMSPIVVRLKRGEEVRKLRLRLLPLLALEDKGRSQSLTLADLKTLEEKAELESSIAALENASRGWYLSDEDFATQTELEASEALRKYKEMMKSKSGGSGAKKSSSSTGNSASSGWSTMGASAKKSIVSSKPSSGAKSNSFAAAFDGDSD